MPDESLMDFIRGGNVHAFETLVSRHHKRFYYMVYRWVLHSEDAEDIVQDAFLKLWSGKAKWKTGKKARFVTWFYRILYNQSMDKLRVKKRTKQEIVEDLPDLSDDAETVEMQKEQQVILRKVISELPEKQRIAVNLFYFEDLPQKQIAAMMGLSLKALESQLTRARTTLRERMASYG